ncbi:hypothetical protein C791_8630 [Amycolatopsis azurea DSM 43854]|uniref:Uncharacterized protein n=1 Tax=Amycolatopsis azurea DSM 43854 TaxID=1238180 RepID=M2PD92_9PSEU|nr:hypothetical protein C791_8630 [Amycolatopsis azurea DSM 43854]
MFPTVRGVLPDWYIPFGSYRPARTRGDMTVWRGDSVAVQRVSVTGNGVFAGVRIAPPRCPSL